MSINPEKKKQRWRESSSREKKKMGRRGEKANSRRKSHRKSRRLEDWLITKEKKGNGQRRLSLTNPLLGVDHLVSFDLRERTEGKR